MIWQTIIDVGKDLRETGDSVILIALFGFILGFIIDSVKRIRRRNLERYKAQLLATGEPGSKCPRCGRLEIVRTISDGYLRARGPGLNINIGESRLHCLSCKLTVNEPDGKMGE